MPRNLGVIKTVVMDTVFLLCLFKVLFIRSDKIVSHMVEESHMHVVKVIDLSCDHGKVILIVDMDTCTL